MSSRKEVMAEIARVEHEILLQSQAHPAVSPFKKLNSINNRNKLFLTLGALLPAFILGWQGAKSGKALKFVKNLMKVKLVRSLSKMQFF